MNRLFFFLPALLLFAQCKTSKLATADYDTPYNYEGRSISFGNGGGFTGRVVEYTLMDNGQIFKGANREGNVTMIKTIPKDRTEQIFSSYDLLGFGEQTVDGPGNMYYYVEMTDQNNRHKLIWGDYDAGESKTLRTYYRNLMSLVSNATTPKPTDYDIK